MPGSGEITDPNGEEADEQIVTTIGQPCADQPRQIEITPEEAMESAVPDGDIPGNPAAPGETESHGEGVPRGLGMRPEISRSTSEFLRSSLESLAWRAAESISAGVLPLGPVIVRALYISKQIITLLEGTRSGEGYSLKVSIPGLDIPIEGLNARLEVLARLRVGEPTSRGPDAGTLLEVQFYEPPTDSGDVGSIHRPSDNQPSDAIAPSEISAAQNARNSELDPWEAWLNLVGARLIHNLSWALKYVAGLPAGTDEASIRIGYGPPAGN